MAAVPPSRQHVTRQSRRDRAPLGGGFRGTCRTTREGGGLPEGKGIPAGITHDLVLQFDLPARRMEREERLLAMHGGDVNATLLDISEEGGGKDARFLLAHGAKANYHVRGGLDVLSRAARNGHLAVVEALLDSGAGGLENALWCAAHKGHTAVALLLLDRGADVHYEDDWALNHAVLIGHLDMVVLLLQRGASATSAIAASAARHGHPAIADLLRAHMA